MAISALAGAPCISSMASAVSAISTANGRSSRGMVDSGAGRRPTTQDIVPVSVGLGRNPKLHAPAFGQKAPSCLIGGELPGAGSIIVAGDHDHCRLVR